MTTPSGAEPDRTLVAEWSAYAIAAAAARFIPVPLLDDAVKERATRIAVLRALRDRGRTYPVTAVEPLYAGTQGWSSGVFRYAWAIPGKVLLFPIRKYVTLFGSVKGVPTDVMTVLLLARTVHRHLGSGALSGIDEKALRQEALAVRRAFDATLEGMDLRLLTAALADVLSQGKGLTKAALAFAQRRFGKNHADDPDGAGRAIDASSTTNSPSQGSDVELAAGAERIETVLNRTEITALLAAFDVRFDELLARSRTGKRR